MNPIGFIMWLSFLRMAGVPVWTPPATVKNTEEK